MAILIQLTCFTFLCLVITHAWDSVSFDDDSSDDDFWSSSIDNDMNKMMAKIDQESRQMSAWSSAMSKAHNNDMKKVKTILAAVKPVCTTTPSSLNSTPTSLTEKNLRKQYHPTQTTTCIKTAIIDGTKYMYREIHVTNDKGIIISQNSDYYTFTGNSNNKITSSNLPNVNNRIFY